MRAARGPARSRISLGFAREWLALAALLLVAVQCAGADDDVAAPCSQLAAGAWAASSSPAADDATLSRGFAWRFEPPCASPSRPQILAALRGRHVHFIGDSVTRIHHYNFLLWLFGCGDAAAREHDAAWPLPPLVDRGAACALFADKIMSRDHRVTVVPLTSRARSGQPPDVVFGADGAEYLVVEFTWATYLDEFAGFAADRVPLLRLLAQAVERGSLAQQRELFLLSAGFWHLRHGRDANDLLSAPAQLDAAVAAMVRAVRGASAMVHWRDSNVSDAEADAAARALLRGSVFFRGLTRIEKSDSATMRNFDNDHIELLGALLLKTWRRNGLLAADPLRFIPRKEDWPGGPRPESKLFLTLEGYHPSAGVYSLITAQLFALVLGALGNGSAMTAVPTAPQAPPPTPGPLPSQAQRPLLSLPPHPPPTPSANATTLLSHASDSPGPAAVVASWAISASPVETLAVVFAGLVVLCVWAASADQAPASPEEAQGAAAIGEAVVIAR